MPVIRPAYDKESCYLVVCSDRTNSRTWEPTATYPTLEQARIVRDMKRLDHPDGGKEFEVYREETFKSYYRVNTGITPADHQA